MIVAHEYPPPEVVQTELGPVECVRSGEGPPVLLLHGAMGGFDQSLLLGRTVLGPAPCRFIAVSRPGYLHTPIRAGRAPEQQADLCAALLDALAVPRASVIAISGGGQCALQFALRHPARCAALVMISACSAPLASGPPLRFRVMTFAAYIAPLTAMMRRSIEKNPDRAASRSIPDPALRARTLSDPDVGPLLVALLVSTLERMPERLPGTRNDIAQSLAPFSYPAERIEAPLLIVHGAADRVVPFAQAASLASRVGGAELLAIPGADHVAIFTHMRQIRPRVWNFVERHSQPSRPSGAAGQAGAIQS